MNPVPSVGDIVDVVLVVAGLAFTLFVFWMVTR
jgi:hypothetical protein